MAKQTINNGDQLSTVRSSLNSNFDELYTATDDLSGNSLTSTELATLRNFCDNWDVTSDGHLIPKTNAASDFGSAEYKVRHLFLSDN